MYQDQDQTIQSYIETLKTEEKFKAKINYVLTCIKNYLQACPSSNYQFAIQTLSSNYQYLLYLASCHPDPNLLSVLTNFFFCFEKNCGDWYGQMILDTIDGLEITADFTEAFVRQVTELVQMMKHRYGKTKQICLKLLSKTKNMNEKFFNTLINILIHNCQMETEQCIYLLEITDKQPVTLLQLLKKLCIQNSPLRAGLPQRITAVINNILTKIYKDEYILYLCMSISLVSSVNDEGAFQQIRPLFINNYFYSIIKPIHAYKKTNTREQTRVTFKQVATQKLYLISGDKQKIAQPQLALTTKQQKQVESLIKQSKQISAKLHTKHLDLIPLEYQSANPLELLYQKFTKEEKYTGRDNFIALVYVVRYLERLDLTTLNVIKQLEILYKICLVILQQYIINKQYLYIKQVETMLYNIFKQGKKIKGEQSTSILSKLIKQDNNYSLLIQFSQEQSQSNRVIIDAYLSNDKVRLEYKFYVCQSLLKNVEDNKQIISKFIFAIIKNIGNDKLIYQQLAYYLKNIESSKDFVTWLENNCEEQMERILQKVFYKLTQFEFKAPKNIIFALQKYEIFHSWRHVHKYILQAFDSANFENSQAVIDSLEVIETVVEKCKQVPVDIIKKFFEMVAKNWQKLNHHHMLVVQRISRSLFSDQQLTSDSIQQISWHLRSLVQRQWPQTQNPELYKQSLSAMIETVLFSETEQLTQKVMQLINNQIYAIPVPVSYDSQEYNQEQAEYDYALLNDPKGLKTKIFALELLMWRLQFGDQAMMEDYIGEKLTNVLNNINLINIVNYRLKQLLIQNSLQVMASVPHNTNLLGLYLSNIIVQYFTNAQVVSFACDIISNVKSVSYQSITYFTLSKVVINALAALLVQTDDKLIDAYVKLLEHTCVDSQSPYYPVLCNNEQLLKQLVRSECNLTVDKYRQKVVNMLTKNIKYANIPKSWVQILWIKYYRSEQIRQNCLEIHPQLAEKQNKVNCIDIFKKKQEKKQQIKIQEEDEITKPAYEHPVQNKKPVIKQVGQQNKKQQGKTQANTQVKTQVKTQEAKTQGEKTQEEKTQEAKTQGITQGTTQRAKQEEANGEKKQQTTIKQQGTGQSLKQQTKQTKQQLKEQLNQQRKQQLKQQSKQQVRKQPKQQAKQSVNQQPKQKQVAQQLNKQGNVKQQKNQIISEEKQKVTEQTKQQTTDPVKQEYPIQEIKEQDLQKQKERERQKKKEKELAIANLPPITNKIEVKKGKQGDEEVQNMNNLKGTVNFIGSISQANPDEAQLTKLKEGLDYLTEKAATHQYYCQKIVNMGIINKCISFNPQIEKKLNQPIFSLFVKISKNKEKNSTLFSDQKSIDFFKKQLKQSINSSKKLETTNQIINIVQNCWNSSNDFYTNGLLSMLFEMAKVDLNRIQVLEMLSNNQLSYNIVNEVYQRGLFNLMEIVLKIDKNQLTQKDERQICLWARLIGKVCLNNSIRQKLYSMKIHILVQEKLSIFQKLKCTENLAFMFASFCFQFEKIAAWSMEKKLPEYFLSQIEQCQQMCPPQYYKFFRYFSQNGNQYIEHLFRIKFHNHLMKSLPNLKTRLKGEGYKHFYKCLAHLFVPEHYQLFIKERMIESLVKIFLEQHNYYILECLQKLISQFKDKSELQILEKQNFYQVQSVFQSKIKDDLSYPYLLQIYINLLKKFKKFENKHINLELVNKVIRKGVYSINMEGKRKAIQFIVQFSEVDKICYGNSNCTKVFEPIFGYSVNKEELNLLLRYLKIEQKYSLPVRTNEKERAEQLQKYPQRFKTISELPANSLLQLLIKKIQDQTEVSQKGQISTQNKQNIKLIIQILQYFLLVEENSRIIFDKIGGLLIKPHKNLFNYEDSLKMINKLLICKEIQSKFQKLQNSLVQYLESVLKFLGGSEHINENTIDEFVILLEKCLNNKIISQVNMTKFCNQSIDKNKLKDHTKIKNIKKVCQESKQSEQLTPVMMATMKKGIRVRMYKADSSNSVLYLFFTEDLFQLNCVIAKGEPIKPKWKLPLTEIFDIQRYTKEVQFKSSAFYLSEGLFTKAPPMQNCLSLNGRTKSFHIYFDTLSQLEQWKRYVELAKIRSFQILSKFT